MNDFNFITVQPACTETVTTPRVSALFDNMKGLNESILYEVLYEGSGCLGGTLVHVNIFPRRKQENVVRVFPTYSNKFCCLKMKSEALRILGFQHYRLMFAGGPHFKGSVGRLGSQDTYESSFDSARVSSTTLPQSVHSGV